MRTGFLAATLAAVVTALLTRPPSQEVVELFDQVCRVEHSSRPQLPQ